MDVKKVTLIAGIGFVLAGLLGFIPGVTTAPHVQDPALAIESGYGRLFGLFPVNVLHNLVHLALGIWALAVYKDYGKSKSYCKIAGVLYAVLAVAGLIPGLNTMFGLTPVHSHDVWLHALFAIPLLYFGFAQRGVDINVGAGRASAKTSFRWS